VPDQNTPHAHTSDLPGWPCPPRVRDIPKKRESWGQINVNDVANSGLYQDDLGFLWVDGDAIPRYQNPDAISGSSPGAIVFWTPAGIGVWVHPKSMAYLGSKSTLEMRQEQDRFLPVNEAVAELPAFVQLPG